MKRILETMKNLFCMEPSAEKAIKEFCQNEYKKDWMSAYKTFKEEGRFPNHIRRTL